MARDAVSGLVSSPPLAISSWHPGPLLIEVDKMTTASASRKTRRSAKKVSKTPTNGHGGSASLESLDVKQIDVSQKKLLREVDVAMTQLKVSIADAAEAEESHRIQQESIRQQKLKLIEQKQTKQAELTRLANSVAVSAGIDIDNKGEMWRLDLAELVFKRIQSEESVENE